MPLDPLRFFRLAEDVMQLDQGGLPAAADGALADVQEFADLHLSPAVVEEETDHFALLNRQALDFLMERTPAFQFLGIVALVRWFTVRYVAAIRKGVAGVMRPLAPGTLKMPGQVEQLSAECVAAKPKNARVLAGLTSSRARRSRRIEFWSTSSVCAQRRTPGKRRSILRASRSSRPPMPRSISSRARRSPASIRASQRWRLTVSTGVAVMDETNWCKSTYICAAASRAWLQFTPLYQALTPRKELFNFLSGLPATLRFLG
jgi:hypothetical protein